MFVCCEDCNTISHSSNTNNCSHCGSNKLNKFTRVVGFITPVSTWSTTRKEEKRVQLDLKMHKYITEEKNQVLDKVIV